MSEIALTGQGPREQNASIGWFDQVEGIVMIRLAPCQRARIDRPRSRPRRHAAALPRLAPRLAKTDGSSLTEADTLTQRALATRVQQIIEAPVLGEEMTFGQQAEIWAAARDGALGHRPDRWHDQLRERHPDVRTLGRLAHRRGHAVRRRL